MPGAQLVMRAPEQTLLEKLLAQHGTLFDAAASLPPIARLEGRGVALAAQFGGEVWLVRHYRRGGSVMSALNDRYMRVGAPRVVSELMVSEAARARGIATPQVKAGAWYDAGIFRRSDIATEYIADSHDLARAIFEKHNRGGSIGAVVTLIRSMIQNGLVHRDLNLKNILIAGPRAYVIDLDRCAIVDRITTAQAEGMRQRFFRSLAKWERKSGASLPPSSKALLRGAFGE